MKKEKLWFVLIVLFFIVFYFLPVNHIELGGPLFEAISLLRTYAREHVLLCLVPAFFIAGAISVFVGKSSILKYFGRKANKFLSYGVASISGSVLAVCSCTVLPIFSSIYKRGAGLGPAVAFLYSGPAINIMAVILTARVLGWQLGLGRALGAVIFSVIIGVIMHYIFLNEEKSKNGGELILGEDDSGMGGFRTVIYFTSMMGILVFANLPKPSSSSSLWGNLFELKWYITAFLFLILIYSIINWISKQDRVEWLRSTWNFTRQIFPLLFAGVFIAGLLLGTPDGEGLIPSGFVTAFVGGNRLTSNFFAAIIGAFMYFATLTEVPIVQGLLNSGMGRGPALALLLAGPALSLPNMLVIRSVLGTKKTVSYIVVVVIMATFSGMLFGLIFQ